MKTKNIILSAIAVTCLGGLVAFKAVNHVWDVASKEAKISWNMPNGKHNGTFEGFTGTFDFDPANPSQSVIKASVDVNTVKSDAGDKLDGHLKTADFFDAANHPKIEFTAENVTKSDSGYVATGKLHLRDSTKTVSIPFKFEQNGKTAMFKGRMEILASDYGVMKKSEKKNDLVVIDIVVPVTEQ